QRPSSVRVEALQALESIKDARFEEAMKRALDDADARVRTAGRRALAKRRPAEAMALLEQALDKGDVIERQGAFGILGEMKVTAADTLVSKWLDKLLTGAVAQEVQLDLLDAAQRHTAGEIKDKVKRYETQRPRDDPLALYRVALVGGDA